MDFFEFLSSVLLQHGYLAVFIVLLLCGIGLPIPEELTLIAAGLVVFEGQASLMPMMAVTVLGILAGDSLLFFLGRRYGPQLLSRPLFSRLLHAERMSRVRRQFDKHGVKAVFFARFFAGIRACVYFTAGTLGMKYRTFLLLNLGGALLSAPISVWLGYHFGEEIENLVIYIMQFEDLLLLLLLGGVTYYVARSFLRRRRRHKSPAS